MKKLIIITLFILTLFILYRNVNANEYIIPDDAIRLRVIANSNTVYDQNIKKNISNIIENNIYNLLKNTTKIEEARTLINDNINEISKEIDKNLIENKVLYSYKIDFGQNHFPEKEYKGIKYKEGNYESLLVTLGEGKGNNWWCVLFPPLCLIEEETTEEVEYEFFIKKIIDKYF